MINERLFACQQSLEIQEAHDVSIHADRLLAKEHNRSTKQKHDADLARTSWFYRLCLTPRRAVLSPLDHKPIVFSTRCRSFPIRTPAGKPPYGQLVQAQSKLKVMKAHLRTEAAAPWPISREKRRDAT